MTPLLAMSGRGASVGASVGRALLARPISDQQLFRNTRHCLVRSGLPHSMQLARTAVSQATAAAEAGSQENTGSSTLPVVIETKGVPILLYAKQEEVEVEALAQLRKLAESPLPVGYVSAMPDVHLGKGVTIGTVFASESYVCPNAVGVDIVRCCLSSKNARIRRKEEVQTPFPSCGMCAVPVDGLHRDDVSLEQLLKLQSLIKRRIPTGFEQHKAALPRAQQAMEEWSNLKPPSQWLEQQVFSGANNEKAAKQLGTLGGGNHFLELVYDETGRVWVMLHSGSRNIGNITAQLYDGKAAQGLEQRGVTVPGGLNYLEINSTDGRAYLGDMDWCQDYAHHNRRFMLERMVDSLNEVTGASPNMDKAVNIHHNYCECTACKYKDPRTGEQVERNLWVTRKGATSAREGQLGIIPGSMGTGSFIVKGKGNPRSWESCSHGAGRRLSRTKAKSTILQTDFESAMAGIVCDTDAGVRDEAPQAYKDLTEVMANQQDLVDIEHRLLPMLNVKGFEKGDGKRKWKRKK